MTDTEISIILAGFVSSKNISGICNVMTWVEQINTYGVLTLKEESDVEDLLLESETPKAS